ncbi:hypothetical protein ACFL3E_01930 [Patescibacteria group bacterium]
MNKSIITPVIVAVFAFSLMLAPASLADFAVWYLPGDYEITFTCISGCSGDYSHEMTIDEMDLGSGEFSGTGNYIPNSAITWDVDGTVAGSEISIMTIVYDNINPGYTVLLEGTIAPDGSLSGTALSSTGQTSNWESTSGAAKEVLEVVHGGGRMQEKDGKRKDWLDVSYGTEIVNVEGLGLVGHADITFHNVGEDSIDKLNFYGTDVVSLNLYDGNTVNCEMAANFTVNGELDGVPGYKVIFRTGDSGVENKKIYKDTARVGLYNGATLIYDTSWPTEFTDQGTCVGSSRTNHDRGNMTIINNN